MNKKTKAVPPPAISLIVPCLNEEENLPTMLHRLAALNPGSRGWEVIVIDDGSTDQTAALAEQAAGEWPWLRLVRHPRNLGLGAAIRTGFLNSYGAIICTMDSDCTFAPERLPELIRMVEQGADIATASPWHPQSDSGSVHPLRRLLSRSCSLLYRFMLRSDLHCYTSLFRAYRRDVLETVSVRSNGFVAVAEILVVAIRAGFVIKEMPMRLDRRVLGESKIGIVASIRSHVMLLTRIGWAAWQPQPTE